MLNYFDAKIKCYINFLKLTVLFQQHLLAGNRLPILVDKAVVLVAPAAVESGEGVEDLLARDAGGPRLAGRVQVGRAVAQGLRLRLGQRAELLLQLHPVALVRIELWTGRISHD